VDLPTVFPGSEADDGHPKKLRKPDFQLGQMMDKSCQFRLIRIITKQNELRISRAGYRQRILKFAVQFMRR
jgi:hypothetical protein